MPKHTSPLLMVLGLIIWSIWFVLMYGFLSVACAITPPTPLHAFTWLNSALMITTVITVLLLLYLTDYCWHRLQRLDVGKTQSNRFTLWIAVGVSLIAAGATLSIGIMVLFFPPCL